MSQLLEATHLVLPTELQRPHEVLECHAQGAHREQDGRGESCALCLIVSYPCQLRLPRKGLVILRGTNRVISADKAFQLARTRKRMHADRVFPASRASWRSSDAACPFSR